MIYQYGSQGVRVEGVINGVQVKVLTANESVFWDSLMNKNPTVKEVVLNIPEGKEAIVKQGNISMVFKSGIHKFKPLPEPEPIIIQVGNKTGTILLDKAGGIVGASFEGGLSLSVLSVSGNSFDELRSAVLTYTLAPFVSGLFFTLAGVLIRSGGRRKGFW